MKSSKKPSRNGQGVLLCDSSQDCVIKDCMVECGLFLPPSSRKWYFITHHHTKRGVLSMGEFEQKDYWKVYLDKETKEKIREIQDHLEANYNGKSDFVQQALQDEQALSIEERIRRLEEEREETDKQIEQLKRIKQEREQQDKLRDKRELLKEKQKKLREIADKDEKSRSEVRKEVVEEMREKAEGSPKIDDVDEYLEKDSIQRKIDRRVDSRFSSSEDKDELVEDINRLQKQVAELNGGEEDYFMDLETVDEVKA